MKISTVLSLLMTLMHQDICHSIISFSKKHLFWTLLSPLEIWVLNLVTPYIYSSVDTQTAYKKDILSMMAIAFPFTSECHGKFCGRNLINVHGMQRKVCSPAYINSKLMHIKGSHLKMLDLF